MNGRFQIGRIAGVPVGLEAGLIVLALVFVGTLAVDGLPRLDPSAPLGTRVVVASATVAVFLGSILAHEFGHATVARRRGVGVLGITLSLFGGYAQLDRQAPDPRSEFAIAAAGPLVNLVIGLVLGGVAGLAAVLVPNQRLIIGALVWLAVINVVLALLNLLPASPLDGGRVLSAALWKRFGEAERARVVAGRAGLVLGAALVPLGIAQAWWLGWRGLVTAVVGLFLFSGARSEIRAAALRRRLATTLTRQVMVADPQPVSDGLTVEQLTRMTGGREGQRVAYPVVRWGAEPVGYVLPADGAGLSEPERSWTSVASLMRATPEVARAWTTEPLSDVLGRQVGWSDLLVVVHEPQAGRVVGTVTAGQIDSLLHPPDLWGRDRRR